MHYYRIHAPHKTTNAYVSYDVICDVNNSNDVRKIISTTYSYPFSFLWACLNGNRYCFFLHYSIIKVFKWFVINHSGLFELKPCIILQQYAQIWYLFLKHGFKIVITLSVIYINVVWSTLNFIVKISIYLLS
jgi:hypothetical protein